MLNRNKRILNSSPKLKLYNTSDSEYQWTYVNLQLDYDDDGNPVQFDSYDNLSVESQSNTAYAQNMFILLQSLWNTYSKLNDTIYTAYVGTTLDGTDAGSQGMLSVARRTSVYTTYFTRTLSMEFTGVWNPSDGTAGANVYYSFTRTDYKGKVIYDLDISCYNAGRTGVGSGNADSQVQSLHVNASNINGDKIEQGDGTTWYGFTSSVDAGNTSQDDITFRGYDLEVYEV